MPLNLVGLLKASGLAGISGQTFHQVDGTESGTKMTDYRMTEWAKVIEETVTETSTTATVGTTVSLVRNPKGQLIQNETLSAWRISLAENTLSQTPYLSNFSMSGVNNVLHQFAINVPRASTGDPSVLTGENVAAFLNVAGAGPTAGSATIQFYATVTGGGTGTYQVRIGLQWHPDRGANTLSSNVFNPPYPPNDVAGIPFGSGSRPAYVSALDYVFNVTYKPFTSSDVEFEWYNTSADRTAGTNVQSTTGQLLQTITLSPGSTVIRYLRFRKIGETAWVNRQYVYSRLGNGTWPNYGNVYVG